MEKLYKGKRRKIIRRQSKRFRSKRNRISLITGERLHTMLVGHTDIDVLRYSGEICKILGLPLISSNRRRKLEVLAKQSKSGYVRLSATRLELKLLYAHYAQQIICGDTDLMEKAEYYAGFIGSKEAYNLQQQVADHERLKAIHEFEEAEEAWELPEEDFDMWRGR